MTLYKVLSPAGQSIHGGNLQWSLPTKHGRRWKPGNWHEVEGPIELCCNGLHLTDKPWKSWVEWNSELFVAEGSGERITEGDKTAFQKARLLRPAPIPSWWTDAHKFVASIKDVPWLKPDGKPLKHWRVFETWGAARAAAWAAAMGAARAAAWDAAKAASRDAAGYASRAAAEGAAKDAALYVQCVHICEGTGIDPKHVQHARDRWEVWTKGYGCAVDVNGVLYVYERIK